MTLFLIATGALYALRLRRSVGVRHLAAFEGGLIALWIAVASPVAHLDHHLLTGHMVQHLLLMVVAAPLILFGARPVLRLPRLPSLCFCWLVGSLTVIVWHIPAAFEIALRSNPWHAFERASFFAAGLVFWSPVIYAGKITESSRWPVPLYLFLGTLPCDVLSAFLTFSDHVVYRHYLSGAFPLTPREDQALAGALMWVTVTLAYMVPALLLTSQLLGEGASEPPVRTLRKPPTSRGMTPPLDRRLV